MRFSQKQVFILSAISLLIASIFSAGYHHFDEHFQILEFANYKLGEIEAEQLPWEFHYQMRPAIQPTMVVGLQRFFGFLGLNNPFYLTFVFRLLSAALTFFSITMLYRAFRDKITDETLKKWFLIGSFLLWFLIYNGVRFSSENWSGNLFILGFACYFLKSQHRYFNYLMIGALFGLSFLFRYQAAFLIFGFGLWLLFIKREKLTHLTVLAIGFLCIFGLGIVIDRWFYGEWTLTTYNYFFQNILEDKVSGFGLKPWWWYFTKTIESGIPPFSLLIVLGFLSLAILKPKSPVFWSILPFLLIHSTIGHKELRFLFPLIPLVPVFVIQGIEAFQQRFKFSFVSNRYAKGFMKVFLVFNLIALLVISFKPADTHISLYKTLYDQYDEPTTLYYIQENPYHRVLSISYYKRNNLSIVEVKTIEDIPNKNDHALVVLKGKVEKSPYLGELVYSTYPDWIYSFNFNNWIERSNPWYVYELKE